MWTVRQLFLLTLLLLSLSSAFAQHDKPLSEDETNTSADDLLENTIETMTEESDEEFDYSELINDRLLYQQNKINLNAPDYEQLMTVFGLTDYQVYHLQRYLAEHGTMHTVYELGVIEGMDSETIARLLNYVTVGNVEQEQKLKLRNVFKYGKHRILMRYGQIIEQQQGYTDASEELLQTSPNARYLGSPQAYLLKYNFNYKNAVRFGFTAEKDAGEEFFKGSNKNGFDFYSLHLFVRKVGRFEAIAVGDYHLSFGQGLVMKTGFSMQKTDNSTDIYRHPFGVKPYTSANETNYLRGAATTIDCKIFDLTLFYSYKKTDARTDTSSTSGEFFIETLQTTGYHRTAGEMATKHTAAEQTAGIHIDYFMRTAHIGATAVYTRFDAPLNRDLSFYNQYEFNGQENINVSVDYRVLVKKTGFFGEIAMSKNLSLATINGIVFNIAPRFSLAVSHRYYSRSYQALHSGAFGEASSNANEQGLFAGCRVILSKQITVNADIDYFRFDWLKYRIDAPSEGYASQVKMTFSINRRFSAYIRFKYKSKALNENAEGYYNEITQTHRQSYRFHAVYQPFDQLTLKSRIEMIRYKSSEKTGFHQGYLIYQDVKWKLQKIPLSFSARFALFDTYSYDERIYTYEDDVLYAFSVPGLYSKGSRVYLVSKISITSHVDFWVKIAQTFYRNKHDIGSGLTCIDGNTRTDIRCQLLLKF